MFPLTILGSRDTLNSAYISAVVIYIYIYKTNRYISNARFLKCCAEKLKQNQRTDCDG